MPSRIVSCSDGTLKLLFQRIPNEKSLRVRIPRTLAKINYRIHIDAIKDQIIPPRVIKAHPPVACAYLDPGSLSTFSVNDPE